MAPTIMFIHGMFLNPKSWDGWREYFEREGFNCVVPAWPLHDGDPSKLRKSVPAGLGELSLGSVVTAMERAAAPYDDLILVGHSVGGLLVQMLLSRGIGSLGVPICSVAPNRMLSLDWGFFRNSVQITNPVKGDEPFPMDADGFYKNFGNTMTREESDAAFQQYAMPDSRNVFRDCMTDLAKIDLDAKHVPMLFIAAEKDEIIPAGLCEKNARAYTHKGSRADYMEFKNRGHFLCGQPRWEEVANYVRTWLHGKTASKPGTVERSAA